MFEVTCARERRVLSLSHFPAIDKWETRVGSQAAVHEKTRQVLQRLWSDLTGLLRSWNAGLQVIAA